MTFTLSLLAATLSAATLGTPATPTPAAPDAVMPTVKPVASSRYAVRYDAARDRYCIKDRQAAAATGTRIVLQECKTVTQWAELGLTIDHRR